jgi:GGDEF domain-containing protein
MNSIAEISSRAFEQLARDGLEPTPPNYSRAFAAAAADAGVIASTQPRGTRSSAVREMADDLRAIADQCIKAAARLHGTLASGKATLKQQLEAAIESSESSTLSVVRASGSNVGNVIGAVAAVSAEKMACAALHCWAVSGGYARPEVPTEAELGRHIVPRADAVQMLRGDLARARRRKEPISIAMIGLRPSTPEGESAETAHRNGAFWYLGEALKSAARRNDLVGRISGQCYLVVLPDTGARTARFALRRYYAAHQRGIPAMSAGYRLVAGVAEWDGVEDHDALIARAALALRTALAGKRDAVVAPEPRPGEGAAIDGIPAGTGSARAA